MDGINVRNDEFVDGINVLMNISTKYYNPKKIMSESSKTR